MAYFRLRGEARDFFKSIRPQLELDFDVYYFCLQAGLAVRRKADEPEHATDLVDYFPGDYKRNSRLIVALFLSRELHELGVSMTERTSVHKAIRGFIDPLSPSHLSDAGTKQLNRYAYGGYDVLNEWFDERPRHLETFLPLYHNKLEQAFAGASVEDDG